MFFFALNGSAQWAMEEIEMEKPIYFTCERKSPFFFWAEWNLQFHVFSSSTSPALATFYWNLTECGETRSKTIPAQRVPQKKNVTNQWYVSAKENERERKKPHGNINKSFTTGFSVFDLARRTRYSIKLITRKQYVPTTVCRKITKCYEYFSVWYSRRLEKDWNQIELNVQPWEM